MRRHLWTALVLGIVLAVACPTPALSDVEVRAPVRISGGSPFPAGCASAADVGNPSAAQMDAEVEPSLAVDPHDPKTIIAEYQQDRVKTGSSLGDVVAVSHDGGRTFKQGLLSGTSRCEGGSGLATDPVVAYGPDGTVYAASQVDDGYVVSHSTDQGRTWRAVRATRGNEDLDFDDKETLFADPAEPGEVHVVWDDIFGPQALGNPASALIQTARIVSSVDAGETWGPRRTVFQPLSPVLAETSPQLLAGPHGRLVVVLSSINQAEFVGLPAQPTAVLALHSDDHGRNWSAASKVGSVPAHGAEVDDPDTGVCVRTGGECPSNRGAVGLAAATEPSGTIDAVWQQEAGTASGTIVLSRSTDGGVRWSAPRPALRAPTQVFLPSVAVGPRAMIGISYDVLRPHAKGSTALDADLMLITSTDGGATFTPPVHVAGPFDIRSAPVSTTESVGRFLGDYQGMVAFPDGFGIDYAASAPLAKRGPSDVFFSRVSVGLRPRIYLSVRPRQLRVGRRVRIHFRATVIKAGHRLGLRNVRLRFGGRRATTNSSGRASLVVRPHHRRRVIARASHAGYRDATVTVRVR